MLKLIYICVVTVVLGGLSGNVARVAEKPTSMKSLIDSFGIASTVCACVLFGREQWVAQARSSCPRISCARNSSAFISERLPTQP